MHPLRQKKRWPGALQHGEQGNVDAIRAEAKVDTIARVFENKNEKFCNPSIKKILVTSNGIPHQLLAAGLQARDIYPELKMYFYKENSNVTWEEFLTTKFGLWINTRSSTYNNLHGSGRTVEKSGILLQIEKAPEAGNGDLTCYVFSLEDAVAHISVTDPSGILTIGK